MVMVLPCDNDPGCISVQLDPDCFAIPPSSTKVAMPMAEAVMVMPVRVKSHMDHWNITLKFVLAMFFVLLNFVKTKPHVESKGSMDCPLPCVFSSQPEHSQPICTSQACQGAARPNARGRTLAAQVSARRWPHCSHPPPRRVKRAHYARAHGGQRCGRTGAPLIFDG